MIKYIKNPTIMDSLDILVCSRPMLYLGWPGGPFTQNQPPCSTHTIPVELPHRKSGPAIEVSVLDVILLKDGSSGRMAKARSTHCKGGVQAEK